MTGADLLRRCRRQKALVKSYEEKIEQLEAEKGLLKSPGLDEKVQTSHKSDLSDILVQIETNILAERKAHKKLKELERAASEAIRDVVKDPLVQAVLRNRYLLYKSVPDTAVAIEYSEDYSKELQSRGLNQLDRVRYDDDTLQRVS